MLGGVAVWRASGRRLESASRRRARGPCACVCVCVCVCACVCVCVGRKGEWDLKCEVVLTVCGWLEWSSQFISQHCQGPTDSGLSHTAECSGRVRGPRVHRTARLCGERARDSRPRDFNTKPKKHKLSTHGTLSRV